MTHDKSSASPESIPDTTEYSVGDVWDVSTRLFEQYKDDAHFVFRMVSDEFFKDGHLHGITAYDLVSGYSVCVSRILRAAIYLAQRGLIHIEWDRPSDGDCRCDACDARRAYLQLPYNYDVDHSIAERERQEEVERAQRAAQNVVNMHRKYEGFVYLIKCGERFKIGITNDMSRRMDQLRGQSPYPLELVHHAKGYNNAGKESSLHKKYGEHRVHGEWFELSSEQVAEIIEDLNDWAREGNQ